MNNERRKRITEAQALFDKAGELVSEAKELLEGVKDDEEEALENMPESLRDGERGQAMQECIDALDGATCDLDGFGERVDFDAMRGE